LLFDPGRLQTVGFDERFSFLIIDPSAMRRALPPKAS